MEKRLKLLPFFFPDSKPAILLLSGNSTRKSHPLLHFNLFKIETHCLSFPACSSCDIFHLGEWPFHPFVFQVQNFSSPLPSSSFCPGSHHYPLPWVMPSTTAVTIVTVVAISECLLYTLLLMLKNHTKFLLLYSFNSQRPWGSEISFQQVHSGVRVWTHICLILKHTHFSLPKAAPNRSPIGVPNVPAKYY